MKAIFIRAYGSPDVLELKDVEVPETGDDGVLVRVKASALNPLDWSMTRGKPFIARLMIGLFKPKRNIPGVDVAGIVEAVGSAVTRFKPGDEVYGVCAGSCAEFGRAKESKLAAKPEGISFEEAAATPVAAMTALQALRDRGHLQAGQKVLVNGASGGVGTFTVQIAKALGATVTAVCSTRNVELVRSLGADEVIDYVRSDFLLVPTRFDLIIDIAASRPMSYLRRVSTPEGTVVIAGAPRRISTFGLIGYMLEPLVLSRLGKQKFVSFMANINPEDLTVVKDLVEAGKAKP